jgi:hypothetical protein
MLSDLGLATAEQKEAQQQFLDKRSSSGHHGCISERICEKCDHIISDSICLCIGAFTCPNCGHENEQTLKFVADGLITHPQSIILGDTVGEIRFGPIRSPQSFVCPKCHGTYGEPFSNGDTLQAK